MMSPMSAEATVVRNYIDILTSLPWKKKTKVSIDLAGEGARRGPFTGWRRSRNASLSIWPYRVAWTS